MAATLQICFFVLTIALPEIFGQHALPSFIKPCSKSDPHFNKCLKSNGQAAVAEFSKGIKEMNVPALDPVDLNTISIDTPGLKVKFDNVVLEGLSGSKINDFRYNFQTRKAVLDYTSNLTMKGHYNVNGRVVILPIQGDGDFKIYLTNMSFHLKYNFAEYKGPGNKDYWKFNVYKQEYKLDKAQFDFKNLYNGNKFLSDTTLRFINENWNLIMNDIAPSAVNQIINACVRVTKKFFTKVPLDALLLP